MDGNIEVANNIKLNQLGQNSQTKQSRHLKVDWMLKQTKVINFTLYSMYLSQVV